MLYRFKLLLFVLFISVSSFSAQRVDITKVIKEEYSSSIVKILLYDSIVEQEFKLSVGQGIMSTSSGVIVDESGLIFTNRHAIEMAVKGYIIADMYYNESKTRIIPKKVLTYEKGMENDEKYKKVHYVGHPLICVQVYGDKKIYIAEVVSYSSTFDGGAILKIVKDYEGNPVTKNDFVAAKIGNANNIQAKDDIIIAGFTDPTQKHMSASLKTSLSIQSSEITGMNFSYQKNFHYFTNPIELNKAKTGCPVFDINNKLIAITVINPTTKKCYFAGVNTLDFLARVDDAISSKLITKGLTSPKRVGNLAFDVGTKWDIPPKEKFLGNRTLAENFKQVVVSVKSIDSGQSVATAKVGLFERDEKTGKRGRLRAQAKIDDESGLFKLKPAVPFKQYYLVVIADGYKTLQTKKAVTLVEYEFDLNLEKLR